MPHFLFGLSLCFLVFFASGCAVKNNPSRSPHEIQGTANLTVSSELFSQSPMQAKASFLEKEAQQLALAVKPTLGSLSSEYGMRKLGQKKKARFHKGIDLQAQRGSPVVASASGVVTFVGKKGAYGKIVEINHGGGMITRYAHLDTFAVKQGTKVAAGKRIGTVGRTGRTTGPNLHFEVLVDRKHINPLKIVDWA